MKKTFPRKRIGGNEAFLRKFLATAELPSCLTADQLLLIAKYESDFDPREQTGSYRGAFQVPVESLDDYNRIHGTTFVPEDLFDLWGSWPVVRFHFETICRSYRAVGLSPKHPKFLGLVYAGHLMGFSRSSGIARLYEVSGGLSGPEEIPTAYRTAIDHGIALSKYIGFPEKQAYAARLSAEWERNR